MAKKKQPKWELAGESLDFHRDDGRWGYTELVRTSGPAPWDWAAEGGELGPVEGRAATAEQARERVEQALGLKPLSGYVAKRVRLELAKEQR